MRSQSQSFLIYILFGILIFVFIFMFGLPSSDCNPQTQDVVGEVGGHEVDEAELRAGMMRAFPNELRGTAEEIAPLRRQVLYNLLTTRMIANAAEEAGLRVSDDELRAYIIDWEKENPDAVDRRLNGYLAGTEFDRDAYDDFISYTGSTLDEYETYKRRELLARNYLTMLESSISVSDVEVRAYFEDQQAGVTLNYAKIAPKHVRHLYAAPTDAEVSKFLSTNMDQVKTHFEENKKEYSKEGQAHLKEIKVYRERDSLSNKGSETVEDASFEDRYEALRKAVFDDKIDWNEAAEKYNEALGKRENGGDRGMISLENMSKETREAIAGKKPGDIVEVEAKYTKDIVYVVALEEAVEAKLDLVQEDIARQLIHDERSTAKLDEISKQIHELTKGGKELQAAVDEALYAALDEKKDAPADAPADDAPIEDAPKDDAPAEAPSDAAPAAGNDDAVKEDAPTAGDAPKADDAPKPDDAPTVDDAPIDGTDAPKADGDTAADDAPSEDGDSAADAPEKAEEPVQPVERLFTSTTLQIKPQVPGMGAWDEILGVGRSADLVRSAAAAKTKGEVLPDIYDIDDGSKVIAVVHDIVSGSDEDFETQKDDIRRAVRAQRAASMLGNWKAILALRHPDPAEVPYGAWIMARFEAARQDGTLKVNADALSVETGDEAEADDS